MTVPLPDEIQSSQIIETNDIEAFIKEFGQEDIKVTSKIFTSNKMLDEIYRRRVSPPSGETLPWRLTNGKEFRARPAEVTVWAGGNGGGKSMLLGQVALWFATQGAPTGILSFEMPAVTTADRILSILVGDSKDRQEIETALNTDAMKKVWLYDKVGEPTLQELYAVCVYMTKKLNCRHIIIDSFMKCVGTEKELDLQKAFMNHLCELAKNLNVHIHLVCHNNKDQQTAKGFDAKMAIKGSTAISDLAFNVFSVAKNWEKQEKKDNSQPYDDTQADVRLYLVKQRNAAETGSIRLWVNPTHLCFCDTPDRIPMFQEPKF